MKKHISFTNFFSIELFSIKKVLDNVLDYFPNVSFSLEEKAKYKINCHILSQFPYVKIDNNSIKLNPFRNSYYYFYKEKDKNILYAPKQKYENEHLIIRKNNCIDIYIHDVSNYKVVIRTINELLIRELLKLDFFPIHASSVVKGNQAIIYFGSKGCGKSTIFLSSILFDKCTPLANDIVFVGKINNVWYAYGTPYELTFDNDFINCLIKQKIINKKFLNKNNEKKFDSPKFRYTPGQFCKKYNTNWQWIAPIKSLNFVKLNPNVDYVERDISKKQMLDALIRYGQDDKFCFDDLLRINECQPKFNYNELINDLDIKKIIGNVLKKD